MFFVLLIFLESVTASHLSKELPVMPDDPLIGSQKGTVHVVFSTECLANYFVYQTLTLKFTFDRVHQPGFVTRILSCDHPESIAAEDLSVVDTLIVPNWKENPRNHDAYPPYNKPVGFMYWFSERRPEAEWTLLVDPDMQFRQAIIPEMFDIPEGWAMAAGYDYLRGVMNLLADRHIPDVAPRNDTYGGPVGRKADKAGTYILIRTRDLMKILPLWVTFTEAVRMDPMAWNLTGDQYVKPKDRPWISEMYGYVFAAASMDIWHKIDKGIQYYPGHRPRDIPVLMHYGLKMQLDAFMFDKHLHFVFDAFACPPWNLNPGRKKRDDRGLFPHPPMPSEVTTQDSRKRYGQLMIIEAVNVLNEALCDRHRRRCPSSEQLLTECKRVDAISEALTTAYKTLHEGNSLCHDENASCVLWANNGDCDGNWRKMNDQCRRSCGQCRVYIPTDSDRHWLQKNSKQEERQSLDRQDRVKSIHLPSSPTASHNIQSTDRCKDVMDDQTRTDCERLMFERQPKEYDPSIDPRRTMLLDYPRSLSSWWLYLMVVCLGVVLIYRRHRKRRLSRRCQRLL